MMLQILVVLAVVLPLLVVALLLFAATKPASLRVERSTSVRAPAERIFPLVDDFHRWRQWSPYEDRDPNLKRTYSGPERGLGAVYEWNGNSNVGQGRMEIIQSREPAKIVIQLDFIKPFEGHNTAEFTFDQHGGSTEVTWLMYGPANYMSKLMQVFLNFDKMIGKDFEAGLARLKAAAEA